MISVLDSNMQLLAHSTLATNPSLPLLPGNPSIGCSHRGITSAWLDPLAQGYPVVRGRPIRTGLVILT